MFKLNKLMLSLVSHRPNIFTGSLVHLYGFWVVNFRSVSLIEPSLKSSVLSSFTFNPAPCSNIWKMFSIIFMDLLSASLCKCHQNTA